MFLYMPQHSDRSCLLVYSHYGLLKVPIYWTSCTSAFGILTFIPIYHFSVATWTFHIGLQQIMMRPRASEAGLSPFLYNSADHSQFNQAAAFSKKQWLLPYLIEWDRHSFNNLINFRLLTSIKIELITVRAVQVIFYFYCSLCEFLEPNIHSMLRMRPDICDGFIGFNHRLWDSTAYGFTIFRVWSASQISYGGTMFLPNTGNHLQNLQRHNQGNHNPNLVCESLLYCSNSCTSLHFKIPKSHSKTLKIHPYMFQSPLKSSSGGSMAILR
jgi:hypothetical protein